MALYYSPVDEDELSFALDDSLVAIAAGEVVLEGYLATHPDARELVLLADAGACSRDSREMRFIAGALQELGLATMQVDLLTEDEALAVDEDQPGPSFELLAWRLGCAIAWLRDNPPTAHLKLGYLGRGSAAAAALAHSAGDAAALDALVVLAGAFDLAGPLLASVHAPALLIVAAGDEAALEASEQARLQLQGERQLAIIPGSADLLADPDGLPQVARLARGWFSRHLAR